MQPQEEMLYTHIIDVSRRGDRDDMIPAQLTLVCRHENPKQAVAYFRDAVGYWLQSTKQGQSAWKESSEDFNYGDLINEQDDPVIVFLLKEAGFSKARVERLDVGVDVGEDYDSRFVGGMTKYDYTVKYRKKTRAGQNAKTVVFNGYTSREAVQAAFYMDKRFRGMVPVSIKRVKPMVPVSIKRVKP